MTFWTNNKQTYHEAVAGNPMEVQNIYHAMDFTTTFSVTIVFVLNEWKKSF